MQYILIKAPAHDNLCLRILQRSNHCKHSGVTSNATARRNTSAANAAMPQEHAAKSQYPAFLQVRLCTYA